MSTAPQISNTMTSLRFKNVHTTVSGDYYQVTFDNDGDSDAPYFLLERQFEMPDGKECYIESHMRELSGPYRVRNAVLSDGMLRLEYGDAIHVEISFSASSKEMAELQSALCDMLPDGVIRK